MNDKERHFSEKGRKILKDAQQHDPNFNRQPSKYKEACYERAHDFWKNVDLSGLSPYEKKNLGRYALHSVFEEGVPYERESREGGTGIMGTAVYSWIRPGWQVFDDKVKSLAGKFGFSETEIVRWLNRHRNSDNWIKKKVVFYTNRYGNRVDYKSRFWGSFKFCSRTKQEIPEESKEWYKQIESLNLKYREGEKLEAVSGARKKARDYQKRLKLDSLGNPYDNPIWNLETAQKFYRAAERETEARKLDNQILEFKIKEKEWDEKNPPKDYGGD